MVEFNFREHVNVPNDNNNEDKFDNTDRAEKKVGLSIEKYNKSVKPRGAPLGDHSNSRRDSENDRAASGYVLGSEDPNSSQSNVDNIEGLREQRSISLRKRLKFKNANNNGDDNNGNDNKENENDDVNMFNDTGNRNENSEQNDNRNNNNSNNNNVNNNNGGDRDVAVSTAPNRSQLDQRSSVNRNNNRNNVSNSMNYNYNNHYRNQESGVTKSRHKQGGRNTGSFLSSRDNSFLDQQRQYPKTPTTTRYFPRGRGKPNTLPLQDRKKNTRSSFNTFHEQNTPKTPSTTQLTPSQRRQYYQHNMN